MSGAESGTLARPEAVAESARVADTCAVVVAGGHGLRFGDPKGKQYVDLCGLPIASWAILAIDRAPSVGHIVVVCSPEREEEMRRDVLGSISLTCEVTIAHAGATRQDSVRSGLAAVPREYPIVAIHDAARPLVTSETVEASTIVATPERGFYWSAQTPQVFRTLDIVRAHALASRDAVVATDDASLIERTGGRVVCVESPRDNIKVTMPEDLAVARALMEHRLIEEGCGTDFAQGGDSL